MDVRVLSARALRLMLFVLVLVFALVCGIVPRVVVVRVCAVELLSVCVSCCSGSWRGSIDPLQHVARVGGREVSLGK